MILAPDHSSNIQVNRSRSVLLYVNIQYMCVTKEELKSVTAILRISLIQIFFIPVHIIQ